MIRLRIPELFDERNVTPYQVARDSGGRLDEGTLYRLQRARGHLAHVKMSTIQALCDYFQVPPGELFEYVPKAAAEPRQKKSKASRKRR
jgi:DNA-binding Xre family transcriptional regulator